MFSKLLDGWMMLEKWSRSEMEAEYSGNDLFLKGEIQKETSLQFLTCLNPIVYLKRNSHLFFMQTDNMTIIQILLPSLVKDVVVADVMTFPTDVQDALAISNLQTCVGQFMDTLMSKPEAQICLPTYSEEDSQLIQGLAVGAGHIECFVAIFEAACADYAGCLEM